MHYMIDPIDAFFQNKGKGKKGKSKFSHMSEQDMFWNFKAKVLTTPRMARALARTLWTPMLCMAWNWPLQQRHQLVLALILWLHKLMGC